MWMWVIWWGLFLTLLGGLPAGYVWQGKILEIVETGKARKIWVPGMVLVIIGTIVLIGATIGLVSSAPGLTMTKAEEKAAEEAIRVWFPRFWIAIGMMLIGAIPAGVVAQSRVLDMVNLKTAQRAFKIGYILIVIGSLILMWVLLPGNFVPRL